MKGGRFTMEDEYFLSKDGRFAAVFDGHGGSGVSRFLKERLYEAVCGQVGCDVDDDDSVSASTVTAATKTTTPDQIAEAFRSAFEVVDRDILTDDALQYQGSTAVAVAIVEEDDATRSLLGSSVRLGCSNGGMRRTLVSANVGDSRAILSRSKRRHKGGSADADAGGGGSAAAAEGKEEGDTADAAPAVAVALTRDHKLSDTVERERVESTGAVVEWDAECHVHRVHNLSVSRAMGDKFAKPAVSGKVDVKMFDLDAGVTDDGDGEPEFVVLASDGLWDVFTDQEAVKFVHEKLATVTGDPGSGFFSINAAEHERRKKSMMKQMSRWLAREAYMRGSGDNITVVVIWLKDF